MYASTTENVTDAVVAGFRKRYGLDVEYVRLGSADLLSRFNAEAESGSVAADLLLVAGNPRDFIENGLAKGWLQPIDQAGLPVLEDGTYPRDFLRGAAGTAAASAVSQIKPWAIAYNSTLLAPEDVPRTWKELTDPKYKGLILIPDVSASDSYLSLWSLLLDEYGEGWFADLMAQQPKILSGSVPAVQALGAGEGALALPTLPTTIGPIRDAGAPVAISQPDLTAGVETEVVTVGDTIASSPNAAKLFANYILSAEGQELMNSEEGTASVYDSSGLPAGYRPPTPEAFARADKMIELLTP